MSGRVYVKAGTVGVNPFRDSDSDSVQATFQRVASPMVFLSRVRTNPKGKLVSVEYAVRNESGYSTMKVSDFVANKPLPNNTEFVRLKFTERSGLSDGLFLVFINFLTGYVDILGKYAAVVNLLRWLNAPISDFKLAIASSEFDSCGLFD